jgi:hypothetical protein
VVAPAGEERLDEFRRHRDELEARSFDGLDRAQLISSLETTVA